MEGQEAAPQEPTNLEGAAPSETLGGQAAEQESNGFDWESVKNNEVEVEVDGEKIKVPLEQLRKDYRYRSAADRRFEEAARMRQEVEGAVKAFNENPVEGLRRLKATDYFQENPKALIDLVGKENFMKFAEGTIYEQIMLEKRKQENPYEVEAEEYKKKLEDYERREREAKEAAEKEELTKKQQAEIEQVRTSMEKEISDALGRSDLPATPETIARYARFYKAALQVGYQPTPDELVDKVRDSYQTEIQRLVTSLPEDQAAKLLGDDFVKKIRTADMQRLKQPAQAQAKRTTQGSDKPPKSYIDPDDFFASVRKKHGL